MIKPGSVHQPDAYSINVGKNYFYNKIKLKKNIGYISLLRGGSIKSAHWNRIVIHTTHLKADGENAWNLSKLDAAYISKINIAVYYNGIPFRIDNPRSKGNFRALDAERQRESIRLRRTKRANSSASVNIRRRRPGDVLALREACMGLGTSRNIGRKLRGTETEGEEVKNGTDVYLSPSCRRWESSPVPLSFDSRGV